mgnify:FL=1
MPSQIKVDEIKNVAGQYKIKTDTFEGQTAASTINITTGSVTTNLSNVIAKSYVAYQTTNPTGVLDSLSFNHSSITDVGTGNTKLYITNPRAQTRCASAHSGGDGSAGYSAWMREEEITTTQYGTGTGNGSFSVQDGDYHCVLTYGDLA